MSSAERDQIVSSVLTALRSSQDVMRIDPPVAADVREIRSADAAHVSPQHLLIEICWYSSFP
jgi:hypothetical protein